MTDLPAAEPSAVLPSEARRSGHSGPPPLARDFYHRDAEIVARELLGCVLVSTIAGKMVAGEIVETEAYVGPDDEASHAHRRFGVTPRNSVMFGPPGLAYVYRIYGLHWCLNAVTGEEGFPAAVLIRALRPLQGWETLRMRRNRPDRDLTRGPANLCQALGVDGSLNGHALDDAPLWIEPGSAAAQGSVARGSRIGISRARDLPLRFWISGSPWVSRGRSVATPRTPHQPSTRRTCPWTS